MSSDNRTALRDLRRTRQRRRLGDLEWFDIAYRVYLFGLGGLTAVVIASDAIDGFIGDDVSTADLLTRGPSIAGIAVAVAAFLGLRSGANGGPISIEVADIRHVLLAPISRQLVMLRPIGQRFRAAMFSVGLVAAILGQFVAREVEGSRAAWAAAGALFGAVVGAIFVGTAVLAHALRLPRWAATTIGALAAVWQAAAAWTTWQGYTSSPLRYGPATLDGSLAFWGIRQRGLDTIAIATAIVVVAVSLALGGRLRPEPLARRGELVSQLRFAATVQDLRTVVLLRRQLRAETMRSRPWAWRGRPASRPPDATVAQVVRARGLRSLRRVPASRVGRITLLAAAGGASASLTISATPLFALGVLAAIFLLGVEAIEPLSQEIDHPDVTDSLPVDRGVLFVHHLVAPAVLLALAGVVGAAAATALDSGHALAAFVLAIPVAWAGATGPVVAAVLDAPPPQTAAGTTITGAPRDSESPLLPPEFAGFSNAFSTFMPVILSGLGVLPILAMRAAPDAATAVRSVVGVALLLAAVVAWVRRRDRWAVRMREFFAQGRAQQAGSPAP